MSYEVLKNDGVIEVRLHGSGSTADVLEAFEAVHALSPRKTVSDVWVLAPEYVIPWDEYATIVFAVGARWTADSVPSRSAIVVANEFQRAQAEFYVQQARTLPFPIRVFARRDQAMAWLKETPGSASGRGTMSAAS
jgi:hypothetical protein